VKVYTCKSWTGIVRALRVSREILDVRPGEELWCRGAADSRHSLLPSLLWHATGLKNGDLWDLEKNYFFEFQARARELHERGLSDWDFLFFMRHHGVPTRVLDWTDSFGDAVYFALEKRDPSSRPCIWLLNPYALNAKTWIGRDLVQPKYITYVDEEFWEYGEALDSDDDWENDGPVAIYPLQISERMRAQRGWFTFHGNRRAPLEAQYPRLVTRLDFADSAIDEAWEFLRLAGIKSYNVYPDLDHLAKELVDGNATWVASRRGVVK
jgi:hypothetical protein